MNDSINGISGTGGFNAEQTGKIKETAGKADREVDSAKSEPQARQADTGDKLSLTERAIRLQETPVVDRAKVEDIKQRIADGSFQIDAGKIAEKLISTDELIG